MRGLLVLLLMPAVAFADEKADALKYIASLRDPATGAYRVTPDGKPSLRACNGAVKAIGYLGGRLEEKEKVAAFVLGCYDPTTGAFAEPGGKPDVGTTSVGVMAAVELGIPKQKFAGAMGYLKANAKTFEEVRIAAAAVEAWGVKECPFELGPWFEVGSGELLNEYKQPGPPDNRTRRMGSAVALIVRLGYPLHDLDGVFVKQVNTDQRADGGWGKGGEKGSDLETVYRVMRALHLLKTKPKDVTAVRAFVAKCRNADGGYGVTPGEKSSMSGTYYAAVVGKWLDGMK